MDYSNFSTVDFSTPNGVQAHTGLTDYHKEQQSYQASQSVYDNNPQMQKQNNSEMVNNMYKDQEEKQQMKEQLEQYKEKFAQISQAYKTKQRQQESKVQTSDMYKSLLYGSYVATGLLIASIINCFWAEYSTTLSKQNQYILKATTVIALVFISSVLKNMC